MQGHKRFQEMQDIDEIEFKEKEGKINEDIIIIKDKLIKD